MKTQMNFSNTSHDALLTEQWDRIRSALESLGKIYRLLVDEEDKELDDIIEDFVMKVEFDSPLAVEE